MYYINITLLRISIKYHTGNTHVAYFLVYNVSLDLKHQLLINTVIMLCKTFSFFNTTLPVGQNDHFCWVKVRYNSLL